MSLSAIPAISGSASTAIGYHAGTAQANCRIAAEANKLAEVPRSSNK